MRTSFRNRAGLCLAIVAVNLGVSLGASAASLVAAWGDNSNGQASPPEGFKNVKDIAANGFHNLALRTDGTVVAWGANSLGQTTVPAGLSGVRSVGAGYMHSLAVKSDGTVVAWGNNASGQASVPPGLSGVTAVAAGYFHSLALKADGRVVAWGANSWGQSSVPAGATNMIAIAASELNSAALSSDGRVVAWGDNTYGQTNVPPALTNAIAITAGERFFAALKSDGTVTAWGWGENGRTEVPPALSNVVAIESGTMHTLALKADGGVVGWGYPGHGVVATPASLSNVTAIAAGATHNLVIVSERVVSPIGKIQVTAGPEGQSVWVGSNVTFTVAASSNEPLKYQWLRNGSPVSDGARVSGATNASLTISPVENTDGATYSVIVSNAFDSVMSANALLTVLSPPIILPDSYAPDRTVGAGADVTLTAIVMGTAPLSPQWFFNGTNLPGKTSIPLSFSSIQPGNSGLYTLRVTNIYGSAEANMMVTVTNTAPSIVLQPHVPQPDQSRATNLVVPIGSNVTLKFSAKGSLPLYYQWRLNGIDIPGATNSTQPLGPVQMDQTGYYSVDVWNAYGEVISAKAFLNVVEVMPWGMPFGEGTTIPVGLSNVVGIAAGGSHVLALRADGTVKPLLALSPYVFDSPAFLTNVPPPATDLIAVAAGRSHSVGLRANGTVVAWGNNSLGQTNVPLGLSNVTAIAAGWSHNIALRSDSTIVTWGSLPKVNLPADLTNVIAVAASSSHSLVLKRDGTVRAWGTSGSPTNVPPGLSNVIAIAASPNHNLALRSDGKVVGWSVSSQSATNVPSYVSNVVSIAAGPGYSLALKADGTIEEWGSTGRKRSPALSNVVAIAAGGVQSAFGVALFGDGSPIFTVQPSSCTTTKGATVQFHARAVGVQPLTYQWQRDLADVPGATNASLILTNVQGSNLGNYRALVSNPFGYAMSRTAALTIPYKMDLVAALNATNMVWLTNFAGSAPWFAQIRETHDGDAAGQSGATTNGQQSILQTTVMGPGTLSFWWKVSSEEGYDYLRFHLDNLTVPYARVSGETDWQQLFLPISAGTHTLRWAYIKDLTVSSGRDAGWLDEVRFMVAPPEVTGHPSDQTVNAGVRVLLCGRGSSQTPITFQWIKDGLEIPGAAQPCLVLPAASRRDSADYALRMSNAGGSVTTSNATLKVIVQQRLDSLQRLADGTIQLRSGDADGGALSPEDLSRFEVQVSTNLGDWLALPGGLAVTNGSLVLTDKPAANLPCRFYRILER